MWFSSCTLPQLSLHEVTARMWQVVFCPSTGNTYCCAKLHYFGSPSNYKEEKRKDESEFSFKSKARICSHLFLYFSASFLLSFFFFPVSSNNLLYFTALLLINCICFIFARVESFVELMNFSIILKLPKIHTWIQTLYLLLL